ncbi:MAG: hypothetical protein R2794_05275 [Chitinophagales bacterium]
MILAVIVLPAFSQALIPGYMGKRLGFIADVDLGYANYHYSGISNYGARYFDYIPHGLNTRVGLNLDYTIAVNTNVGFGYQRLFTKIPFSYYSTASNDDFGTPSGFLGDVKVGANIYSVFIKFYSFKNKGAIAPIGRYNKFEIGVYTPSVKTGKNVLTDVPHDAAYPYALADIPVAQIEDLDFGNPDAGFVFFYSFGGENIVADKWITDFNVNVGITQMIQSLSLSHEFVYAYNSYEYDQTIARRIGTALLVNFSFGIGYLK